MDPRTTEEGARRTGQSERSPVEGVRRRGAAWLPFASATGRRGARAVLQRPMCVHYRWRERHTGRLPMAREAIVAVGCFTPRDVERARDGTSGDAA